MPLKIISTLLPFIFLIFLACNTDLEQGSEYIDLSELPVERPAQIMQTDHVGDFYFDHLNYATVALQNGNILINDREQAFILEISPDGKLVRQVTRQGRGPGEILDASRLHSDHNGNLVLFDQMNQKAVRYINNESPEEFMPHFSEGYRVRTVYPLKEENQFLVFQWMPSALMDDSNEFINRMLVYDLDSENYIKDHTYPGQTFAQLIVDEQVRGGSPVPYTPEFLYSFSPERDRIYVSWTEENEIAVLSTNLDTLNTIRIPLTKDRLTQTDIDSLENWSNNNLHRNQWRTIEEKLPDYKVSYDEMIVDHHNRIWLKLTRQSADQEWLVISENGDPFKIVNLPKEGILTHISEHHLGFRENDYTFSLYEAVD